MPPTSVPWGAALVMRTPTDSSDGSRNDLVLDRSLEVGVGSSPVQAADAEELLRSPKVLVNLVLFLATVLSVCFAGALQVMAEGDSMTWSTLLRGWVFAVPLLSILLAHEFGHYIAARVHGVPASLPYFIPMPNIFGTMGAVIAMRGRIASRKALLDIGASGPLAGMVVALPVLVIGLLLSEVRPVTGDGILEGQCILYSVLKWIIVGHIPDGHDVFLHPAALAGWAGLFVTMINLLPVGQLDGGHIAYALLGPVQNRVAKVIHYALLPLFVVVFLINSVPLVHDGTFNHKWDLVLNNSSFWLVWFALLYLLRRLSGADHPPTEPGELGRTRRIIAIGCLILFVLLFMPTPLSRY